MVNMRCGRGEEKSRTEARTHFFILIFRASVPTGFFFSAPGFFFTQRHKTRSCRGGGPASAACDPLHGPSGRRFRAEIGLSVWRRKETTKYASSDTAAEPSPPLYTHQHTRTLESCTNTKNPIFCRIADFIPVSLSHFFPSKNFDFGERLGPKSPPKVGAFRTAIASIAVFR